MGYILLINNNIILVSYSSDIHLVQCPKFRYNHSDILFREWQFIIAQPRTIWPKIMTGQISLLSSLSIAIVQPQTTALWPFPIWSGVGSGPFWRCMIWLLVRCFFINQMIHFSLYHIKFFHSFFCFRSQCCIVAKSGCVRQQLSQKSCPVKSPSQRFSTAAALRKY